MKEEKNNLLFIVGLFLAFIVFSGSVIIMLPKQKKVSMNHILGVRNEEANTKRSSGAKSGCTAITIREECLMEITVIITPSIVQEE